MNIQEYPIVEKSVYSGVALGVQHLLKDVSNFNKPEVVVDTIVYHVMSELCDVIDFGQTALKFSPALMTKMWQAAQEQAEKEAPKA
jgi:hypothetical protein